MSEHRTDRKNKENREKREYRESREHRENTEYKGNKEYQEYEEVYINEKAAYAGGYPDEFTDEEQEALEYEQRRRERAQRRAEMKRRKQKQMRIRRIGKVAAPCVVILVLFLIIKGFLGDTGRTEGDSQKAESSLQNGDTWLAEGSYGDGASGQGDPARGNQATAGNGNPAVPAAGEDVQSPGQEDDRYPYSAHETGETTDVPGEVVSSYAILVDAQTGDIIAQRNAKTRINPASMTKVLTVLVAAEHITKDELDDTFTITRDILDYSFSNDCSNVGFEEGEEVPIKDLFYGTILPSGADAALGLAYYVAGSEEAFVELMNEKLEELGLSGSAHFTNCVGLYDTNHYCSVYDMAMIMQAALDNELCREVLSTHYHVTSATEIHPEGLELSNWFLRRIEDKDAGGFVLAGKTGYVVESGSCAVSGALDGEDNLYICATGNSTSSWRCIYDHVDIYKRFLPQSGTQAAESQ